MKNNLKDTIESLGLSYKKEMLRIIAINLVLLLGAFAVFFFLKNYIFTIILFIGTLILDYFLLTRFRDKKKAFLKERENELIVIISYFEVYIQNKNNVYQSFNMLLPYCSDWMKDKIENLLKEIDSDKSVQPFINFANNFKQLASHSLLLSIYQMVEQGESPLQLKQFNVIFDELTKQRNKEMIQEKEKGLANVATFPLIGAGIITVTLTISILSILGDLMNVI